MKRNYNIAIIAAAATGIFAAGAVSGSMLKAQGAAPGYVIFEIAVTDMDNYKKEFLPPAQKVIADHGGKYVAVGKTMTLEGTPAPNRVGILRFDSMDKAKAWFNSKEQRDARKIGDKYASSFREIVVEGVEQK